MSITLRLVKGVPLTHQEMDNNFTHLNDNNISSVSGNGNGTLTITKNNSSVITTDLLHSHTANQLPSDLLTTYTTDNLVEGTTNKYFTSANVDGYLTGGTGINYSSGVISLDSGTIQQIT